MDSRTPESTVTIDPLAHDKQPSSPPCVNPNQRLQGGRQTMKCRKALTLPVPIVAGRSAAVRLL